MRVVWKDHIIAKNVDRIVVEGNHHFPPESLRRKCARDSSQ